jgi:hypothetical protein
MVWFLLRMDQIHFKEEFATDLNARQIRYLMTCLDRLPEPITVSFDAQESWSDACWDAFIDELPRSKGIKRIVDPGGRYSKKDLKPFLTAINHNPTICELEIRCSISTAAVLNDYLAHNKTLRKLSLEYEASDDVSTAPDLSYGLLANCSLTDLTLDYWPVTPALAHVLAAPGKAVTRLHLRQCRFAAGAVTALADALAEAHTLTSLSIDFFCSVCLAEQKAFHDALRCNRSLVTLHLNYMGATHTHLFSLWEMLRVNLRLCNISHGLEPNPIEVTDHLLHWALLPQIRERLKENLELPFLADHFPMAQQAFSILPGNLPYLPPDASANIARFLLQTDASALPTYRTLHMLALHSEIRAQGRPAFPEHLDLASHPHAQQLAQCGRQALPLPPDVTRSIALFCIRHKAAHALNWLVVHACKGELDLRASQFEPGEAGWLIRWTRAAPCHIKLRLDHVALKTQDIADIARHLAGNPALTALSLQGCVIAAKGLQLICEALKTNTAMVRLLLSKDLITPEKEAPDRSIWPTQLWNEGSAGGYDDSVGRALAEAFYLGNIPIYPVKKARYNLFEDLLKSPTPTYLSMATIAFALRRNNRLHNGVPDLANVLPDKAFVDEISIASKAFSEGGFEPAPE